ncbi:I78 family peptidase inhibitor [Altererythrobacter sp.]|uniref:I78 family peptidase inhibitor n=1 Tax=Altererythrobacter sp. TaxID=1872480 RepID=UPI003D092C08
MHKLLLPIVSLGLASCAGYDDMASAPTPVEIDYICDAAAAQGHIGHDATQAMGAAIQKDSGARTLRWGPPNSAWTMDYRKDRVNVRYDDGMKITEITCG